MTKELELHGFTFEFTLPGVVRDKVFNFTEFNYGSSASFFQKFKNKIPVEYHDDLRSLKDIDVYVVDQHQDHFTFNMTGVDQDTAVKVSMIVLNLCKIVHGFKNPVQLTLTRRVLVEQTVLVTSL